MKSQSMFGSNFTIEGFNEIESGKVMGTVEFKNTLPGTGMDLSSKWFSDNTIATEINMAGKFYPGSRIGLLSKLDPKGGNIAGGVQVEYKNEFMLGMVEASLTGDGKPMLSPSFVFT